MTDWDALTGMACTCPPQCTTGNQWGDGPRDCDPLCRPCQLNAGRTYTPPGARKKAAQQAARTTRRSA